MAMAETSGNLSETAPTGIVFDVKKYAIRDGPGIRTTVFFKGCPLNCQWCHNPESRRPGIERFPERRSLEGDSVCAHEVAIGRETTVDQIMTEILQDRVFYEQSGGGVTFSGGEPLFQPEFLLAVLDECRRQGLSTAVDTSGFAARADLESVYHATDLILYDLKLMDDDQHRRYVGVSNQVILSNYRALASEPEVRMITRVALIPGITDTDENLLAVAEFMQQFGLRRISLLPYNKLGEDKRLRYGMRGHHLPMKVQDDTELAEKTALFEDRGFEVTVGG